jgi:hypothetical protein
LDGYGASRAAGDSTMELLELAPAGMIGWVDELEHGSPMTLSGPNELQIKIVATPEGLIAFALAEQEEEARKILISLGFRPEHIRRMLCG